MSDFGMKISRDGKSINSEEPTDFVFNSKYGSVKVVKEPASKTYETVNVNNGASATATIAHGLPFVPLTMLFTELKPGSGHWYQGGFPWPDPTDLSGAVTPDATPDSLMYVDDTNLKITYYNGTGGNLTVKYYYFVFGDNG